PMPPNMLSGSPHMRAKAQGQNPSDALGTQIESAPDGFWPCAFARMCGEPESMFGGIGVWVAKKLWHRATLVTADTKPNDIAVVIAHCKLCYPLRFRRSKLPHRIKNPEKSYAEVALASHAAAFQSFEDRVELLLSPQAHAYRNVNFGVQNVFRFEPLHQAISDQLVVVWALQVLSNGLEGHEEAAEVFELIKLFDCGKGSD